MMYETILLSDLPKFPTSTDVGFWLIVDEESLVGVLQHLETLEWCWRGTKGVPMENVSIIPYIPKLNGYGLVLFPSGLAYMNTYNSDVYYYKVLSPTKEVISGFCNNSSHPGRVVSCGIGPGSQSFLYCPVCKIEKT